MEDDTTQDQSGKALAIVEQDGKFLLDSRVLAKQLGYEHKALIRNIHRNKTRIEAKSVLRQFDAKPSKGSMGGRPEAYYMLTERQCLILTGSLKKGVEADEWHDRLVDEFLAARAMVKQLQKQLPTQPQVELFPLQEMMHDQALKNWNRVSAGSFGVLTEMYSVMVILTGKGYMLPERSKPDGSVGKVWRRYAKEHYGIDPTGRYDYLDEMDRVWPSFTYALEHVRAFRDFLQDVYFIEYYPKYKDGAIERQAKKNQQIEGHDKNRPQIKGK